MGELLAVETSVDYGKSLDSADIEKGLREMNPDISFDMPNRLSHASFVMQGVPDFETLNQNRKGVYYNGYYICPMDRGMVTEVPVTEMELGHKEIPAIDVDKYDEVLTSFLEVLPTDPDYNNALVKAQLKDDNYVQDPDGKVFRYRYVVLAMMPGRTIRVGWKSTFRALVAAKIPGVTKQAIERRFGVDLSRE